jgi:wobble nucleotide-excising tRNase
LGERIGAASQKLSTFSIEVKNYLDVLARSLEQKRDRVFEACIMESSVAKPDCSISNPLILEINELIRQHNQQTDDFEGSVREARMRLEEHYVDEAYEEFSAKEKVAEHLSSELRKLRPAAVPIQEEIARLERNIVEHRQPAEELNRELASYLGRNDLQLEVSETGYTLVRETQPATNLSEGEKTAFAFLYFLKGLQDKGFDLSKGIVVIDDPVSSLDSNSLFSAFGFMKERAKDAGQLFIFTHSFGFFRQVKNWFNHLENQKKKDFSKRPARFYMLDPVHDGTMRKSTLKALDPLLHEYESEYHYLFKKLYEEAQVDKKSSLAVYYGLPNMARRLLEAFLAFRYPSLAGNLIKQIEQVRFEPARKARLLRFYAHTLS